MGPVIPGAAKRRARKTAEPFDLNPNIGYKSQRISLNRGAIARALLTAERVRSLRADLQPAPGRLRVAPAPAIRLAQQGRESFKRVRPRATPASFSFVARVSAPERRIAAVEKRRREDRGGAPKGERAFAKARSRTRRCGLIT